MAGNSRRRNALIVLLIVIIAILLLLTQCLPKRKPAGQVARQPTPSPAAAERAQPAAPPASAEPPPEVLTPATLTAPERVAAGAPFTVAWTGPANPGDFVTIVKPDAAAETSGNYRETKDGSSLELTAPMETGAHEVRYVAARSRTVLGRTTIEVTPTGATLDAPSEVILGSKFQATWTGPNNEGDYITIVGKDSPDHQYDSYADTAKGSPAALTAPTTTGDSEIRYVSGQGRKVLARRPIKVIAAEVSLRAVDEAIAGSRVDVTWTGPKNAGDYITVVPKDTPDGRYQNYTDAAAGSPLSLLMPIMEGEAELRYMTGQGHKVLARRPIRIVAAKITLAAPEECGTDAPVNVTWTGPNNPGDYITIVPRDTPDGQHLHYANTSAGSPLSVKAPTQPGPAEVRYVSGQGNKVLARFEIKVRSGR